VINPSSLASRASFTVRPHSFLHCRSSFPILRTPANPQTVSETFRSIPLSTSKSEKRTKRSRLRSNKEYPLTGLSLTREIKSSNSNVRMFEERALDERSVYFRGLTALPIKIETEANYNWHTRAPTMPLSRISFLLFSQLGVARMS